ncbi:hypothetical protein ABK040_015192 [Willaertia magna]
MTTNNNSNESCFQRCSPTLFGNYGNLPFTELDSSTNNLETAIIHENFVYYSAEQEEEVLSSQPEASTYFNLFPSPTTNNTTLKYCNNNNEDDSINKGDGSYLNTSFKAENSFVPQCITIKEKQEASLMTSGNRFYSPCTSTSSAAEISYNPSEGCCSLRTDVGCPCLLKLCNNVVNSNNNNSITNLELLKAIQQIVTCGNLSSQELNMVLISLLQQLIVKNNKSENTTFNNPVAVAVNTTITQQQSQTGITPIIPNNNCNGQQIVSQPQPNYEKSQHHFIPIVTTEPIQSNETIIAPIQPTVTNQEYCFVPYPSTSTNIISNANVNSVSPKKKNKTESKRKNSRRKSENSAASLASEDLTIINCFPQQGIKKKKRNSPKSNTTNTNGSSIQIHHNYYNEMVFKQKHPNQRYYRFDD